MQRPPSSTNSARGAQQIFPSPNGKNLIDDRTHMSQSAQSKPPSVYEQVNQSKNSPQSNQTDMSNYYQMSKGQTIIKMSPITYRSPDKYIQTPQGLQRIESPQQTMYVPIFEVPVIQQPIQVVDLKQYDEQQQKRIKDLEDKLKNQKPVFKDDTDTVNKLNLQIQSLNNLINQLKQKLQQQQNEIEQLNLKINAQDDQINQLQEQEQQLESELDEKNKLFEESQQTITELEIQVEELQNTANMVEYWKSKFKACSDELHKTQEDLMHIQTENEVKNKTKVSETVTYN